MGIAPPPAPRTLSGFCYRLFSGEGAELGEFVTAAPDWHVGDEFFTAQRRRFRITAIVAVDEPDSR